jgi:thymidylate kinase
MAKSNMRLSGPPLKNSPSLSAKGEEPLAPTLLATADVQHSLMEFLRLLFGILDREEVRYCVLHSWGKLPIALESDHDLDLAIHPDDAKKLPIVFRTLTERGYLPLQRLNYEFQASAFVFGWFEDLAPKNVMVDLACDHRESGFIWKSGEALVAGRQRVNGIWVADPATEFAYLLTKKVSKGVISPRVEQRLVELIEMLGLPKAENTASELFGEGHKKQVLQACLDRRLGRMLASLKPVLLWRRIWREPLKAARCVLEESVRLSRRFHQPTGLSLVFLGPDGVGKSTLVTGLLDALKPVFRRDHTFHWRPGVFVPIRDGDSGLANPHDEPPRGAVLSVLYLFGFFLDFWVGHILRVRPLLTRSGLVIFDRYYYDILVDPKRYRYAGPLWLLRVMALLLPDRDELVFVLDAPEEVILSRKRQLSEEELRRMRADYRKLCARLKQSHLIETQWGPQETLAQASRIVSGYLADRLKSREISAWSESRP